MKNSICQPKTRCAQTSSALAFNDDEALYQQFCDIVREAVPEAEAVVMRGSSVTGCRYRDNAPFDADGPGTSDLDLTLVGADVLRYYALDGYWIPGIHSRPLSKEDPDIAPDLVPLRERLMAMVNRPVNIQGTRSWMQYLRGDMMGQPYLTMFGKVTSNRYCASQLQYPARRRWP